MKYLKNRSEYLRKNGFFTKELNIQLEYIYGEILKLIVPERIVSDFKDVMEE